jgi:hypothetical protein
MKIIPPVKKFLTLSLDLDPELNEDLHSPLRLDQDPEPHIVNADPKHWL